MTGETEQYGKQRENSRLLKDFKYSTYIAEYLFIFYMKNIFYISIGDYLIITKADIKYYFVRTILRGELYDRINEKR